MISYGIKVIEHMKKTILLSLVAMVMAFAASAQNTDSLTFANAKWDVKQIDKGITLKQFHFTGDDKIFDSHQYVSIVEIDVKRAKGRFALANDQGKITQTSKFAKDSGAIVAINGTFYNMKIPYNCVTYFKKNGVLCYENTEAMEQRDNAAVAITAKGVPFIEAADAENPGGVVENQAWPERIAAPSVVASGPILLVDGEEACLKECSFNSKRHPRSAMGTKGKKVYLVAVDGRSPEYAQGMTLWEFADIMRFIGAEDAINLDGGGSTTLYVAGENETGIVNHPSDNKKFDREGERFVVNSILFIKK